jgi:3'5'-cyclic nucleotide phosphodiesterase
MSVVKLLSRIVAPAGVLEDFDGHQDKSQYGNKATPDSTSKRGKHKLASTLHDHTYGITSDPLTQFAVVFSALIHDVDHQGVPNTTLVQEGAHIAKMYRNRSVAEQNSVDLAWELLMAKDFVDLRNAIYASQDEAKRFRQLVVNTVLATDIMDADLKTLRNSRWSKAFCETATNKSSSQPECAGSTLHDTVNRKATIVIEHLIQASDVAHTMQHWHVYRKWNSLLFQELYRAYHQGRIAKNPVDAWYEGELGFFDYYIIPLAKKLKECGVFGVSGDEYLDYAVENRKRWEDHGKELVVEMHESMMKWASSFTV